MEVITVGEIILLDNQKEYICVRKIIDDGKPYLFLMSNFKPLEIKFAREVIEGDVISVTIIGDHEEKQRLFALFQADARNEIGQK